MKQVQHIATIWRKAAIKGCAVISTPIMTEGRNDSGNVGVTCD